MLNKALLKIYNRKIHMRPYFTWIVNANYLVIFLVGWGRFFPEVSFDTYPCVFLKLKGFKKLEKSIKHKYLQY